MSRQEITRGMKTGKPVKAKLGRTAKKGTLFIKVLFEFMEPATGTIEMLDWTGWLTKPDHSQGKKGALENTLKTLHDVLGFNGNTDCEPMTGLLTDPNALDWNREVSLDVAWETNPENGKSYPKIQWVNPIGGGQFMNCTPEEMKTDLDALGFSAMYLAVKQQSKSNLPPPVSPLQQEQPEQFGFPMEEDLPF